LTHWTIRFLASDVKVSVPGLFTRDYGYADVILWEHNRDAVSSSVLEPVLAFRQSGPKKDYLWRTGISKSLLVFTSYVSNLRSQSQQNHEQNTNSQTQKSPYSGKRAEICLTRLS
jgi:hypothetical protein